MQNINSCVIGGLTEMKDQQGRYRTVMVENEIMEFEIVFPGLEIFGKMMKYPQCFGKVMGI